MKKNLLISLSLFICSTFAFGSTQLDREYGFKRVSMLRMADNVNGIFGDSLQGVAESFLKRDRFFEWVQMGAASDLLANSKMEPLQWYDDPEILKTLQKKYSLDLLIRAKLVRSINDYSLTVDILLGNTPNKLVTQSEPITHNALSAEGVRAVERVFLGILRDIFEKLPIKGVVTGRDGDSVTLKSRESIRVEVGDTLNLGTIEKVDIHPLYKTVASWNWADRGKLKVISIDGDVIFASILEESSDRPVARNQKLLSVEKPARTGSDSPKSEEELFLARLGYVGGGLVLGNAHRDFSSGATTQTASSIIYGVRAVGELWVTGQASLMTDLQYHLGSLKGSTLGQSRLRVLPGYSFPLTSSALAPELRARFGYQRIGVRLPNDSSTGLSAITGSYGLLSLEGELPLSERLRGYLSLALGLIGGVTDNSNLFGKPQGDSYFSFGVGGMYKLDSRLQAELNLEFESLSVDYPANKSTQLRNLWIRPALRYYF